MLFRRRRHLEVWHWCPNCSSWPDQDFEEVSTPPPRLCRECVSKASNTLCGDGADYSVSVRVTRRN
jgi:hypothetical protein